MSCFYFCFFLLIFVFKVLGYPDRKFMADGQARNGNNFGKRPMQETSPGRLSDKNVTKGYCYEDGKLQNGSNYQDSCLFLISLYKANPFAVNKYFCRG